MVRSTAPHIADLTSSVSWPSSPGATSNRSSSWTCRSIRDRSPLPLISDRDGQVERAAHGGPDQLRELAELAGRHLEQELVVDLQEHPGPEPAAADLAVHGQHGDLDDVRR